ncbi:hypothetical protein QJS10_CPA03g00435 [Acorus calamus]|uniref:Uncharacterized protein n=1 Tax=Acorus calamus TaxID=4465 RepID=A0AAV9F6M1_ACOCL|nr:hypothetical protein QJS10_CPA03g00435 [Acorus calamus]
MGCSPLGKKLSNVLSKIHGRKSAHKTSDDPPMTCSIVKPVTFGNWSPTIQTHSPKQPETIASIAPSIHACALEDETLETMRFSLAGSEPDRRVWTWNKQQLCYYCPTPPREENRFTTIFSDENPNACRII